MVTSIFTSPYSGSSRVFCRYWTRKSPKFISFFARSVCLTFVEVAMGAGIESSPFLMADGLAMGVDGPLAFLGVAGRLLTIFLEGVSFFLGVAFFGGLG